MENVGYKNCPSCKDSLLSTIASIVGILIFVYAISVGLYFYYQSFLNSVEDIDGLLDSIDDLEIEILTYPLSLAAVVDLSATVEGPTLTRDHSDAKSAAIQQINDLKALADRFSKGYSSFQRLRHRGRFLFEQQELTRRRGKVDIAVEKTRSAAMRSVHFYLSCTQTGTLHAIVELTNLSSGLRYMQTHSTGNGS